MQVRCVRAFGYCQPGDVVDILDGASVDPEHWEPVTVPPPDDPPRPLLPVPPVSAVTVIAEEM